MEKRNERNNLVGEKQSNEIEKENIASNYRCKLEITYPIPGAVKTGYRAKILWSRDPLIEYKNEAFFSI